MTINQKELSREDLWLVLPLLDMAMAGVVLGFKPSDREMREQAERCWETLKPILSHHLFCEDERVLPWAKGMDGFSPAVMPRLKKSHDELRGIAKQLASALLRRGYRLGGRARWQIVVHARRQAR
jgi:hypothetical protein